MARWQILRDTIDYASALTDFSPFFFRRLSISPPTPYRPCCFFFVATSEKGEVRREKAQLPENMPSCHTPNRRNPRCPLTTEYTPTPFMLLAAVTARERWRGARVDMRVCCAHVAPHILPVQSLPYCHHYLRVCQHATLSLSSTPYWRHVYQVY